MVLLLAFVFIGMLIVTFPVSHEATVEDLDFIFCILAFLLDIVCLTPAVAGILAVRMALAVVEDVIIAIMEARLLRQQRLQHR